MPRRAKDKNDLLSLPEDLTLDRDTSDIALADVDDLDLPVGVDGDLISSDSSDNNSLMIVLSMKVIKVSDTLWTGVVDSDSITISWMVSVS